MADARGNGRRSAGGAVAVAAVVDVVVSLMLFVLSSSTFNSKSGRLSNMPRPLLSSSALRLSSDAEKSQPGKVCGNAVWVCVLQCPGQFVVGPWRKVLPAAQLMLVMLLILLV